MIARRSFLRLFGSGAVAAPLAAKAAADKAVADLAGVSLLPNASLAYPSVGGGPPTTSGQDDWKRKALRFLSRPDLPDWYEEVLRERALQVTSIDPDIACKRSWSMSVKIMTQRQRNLERMRKEAIAGPRRSMRLHEFQCDTGIWL